MRIGHYDPSIWANGGIASYIRRVSQEQKRLGHEIIYFDSLHSHIAGREDEQTISIKDDAEMFRTCAKQNLDILHLHSTISSTACPVPMIRTLHTHQPYCPNGGRFLKRLGQPCNRSYNTVGCAFNHFVNHCGSVRPIPMIAGFRATGKEMRTLHTIPTITVSQFLKEQMVRSGYAEHNIHVLHLPAPDVRVTAPPPREGTPHFLFLGRLTPQKGVDWLLRATKAVTASIHIDIAGEGYDEAELHRLSAQLGLEDRVTFHGWVSGEKLNSLIIQARALVFPSIWHEPAGFVSLDASVNGRAIIASRVGGISEYVSQDINGLLVEPNNVANLVWAMECLASDWPLANRLGEAGRRIAPASFSLKSHVETLMKLYLLSDFSQIKGISKA